jgi:hypothetical protein
MLSSFSLLDESFEVLQAPPKLRIGLLRNEKCNSPFRRVGYLVDETLSSPKRTIHTELLATMLMRKLTVTVLLVTVLGCTEQPSERTKLQLEAIEQMISSIKVEIEEFVQETGIESKPIDQAFFIDSLYNAYLKVIDNGKNEEIKDAFTNWTNTVSTVYLTDYELNYLNNTNSLSHKLELSITSLKLLMDLKSSLEIEDVVFDQIEVVFIPQISELKLGESYEAEIFMGALMKRTSDLVDYYYDGNKLEKSETGGGKIIFKPDRTGVHTISVTAQVEGPNNQPFEFKNEICVLVK